MNKYFATIVMTFIISVTAYAESTDTGTDKELNYIPLVQYDYISLDSQEIHSPGGGLAIQGQDLMFVGLYTRHLIQENPTCDYPDAYHSIDILFDVRDRRHQYLGLFKSQSNEPVYGGYNTFQTAFLYGYEFIKGDHSSLIFGGGLAVSDFGIETSEGDTWPAIPVPLLRYKYTSTWLQGALDFITGPNVNMVFGPASRLRFTIDTRMDEFRDLRDVLYEFTLGYRFFSPDHEMGDFAGIAIGFMNANYGAFDLNSRYGSLTDDDDTDESLEMHYYSVFATLDITLLKITGGYAFGGRELCRDDITRDLGNGYFVSLQGLYQF